VPRILIAEDEPRVASFLARGLRASGYTTDVARDGVTALEQARSGGYDLLVLDLGLPRMDGFRVLTAIRQERLRLRVIVLTARDGAEDVVGVLESGADDYMRKPFHFAELLARVKLRLESGDAPNGHVLRYGDLAYDARRRQVTVGENAVAMSPRELALVELFLRNPGQVLPREQLLNQVWGYDFDPGSNVLEVYIGYLRRKLGGKRIQTVRRLGYRLTADGGR
jgi:DNA-binding response OmpR family regulator